MIRSPTGTVAFVNTTDDLGPKEGIHNLDPTREDYVFKKKCHKLLKIKPGTLNGLVFMLFLETCLTC